jgi:hypothetical protein
MVFVRAALDRRAARFQDHLPTMINELPFVFGPDDRNTFREVPSEIPLRVNCNLAIPIIVAPLRINPNHSSNLASISEPADLAGANRDWPPDSTSESAREE